MQQSDSNYCLQNKRTISEDFDISGGISFHLHVDVYNNNHQHLIQAVMKSIEHPLHSFR